MTPYRTLDYLPDLTPSEMAAARTLSFSPYSASNLPWDIAASAYGSENYAILHSTYKITLNEGATADFFSTSYFDPYLLEVFDSAGNVIAANDEADDGRDIFLTDAYYSRDVIFNFVAPYTGTYYVDASWHQGSFYKFYSLSIYVDTDTGATVPTSTTKGPAITAAFSNILRSQPVTLADTSFVQSLTSQADNGTLSLAGAIQQLAQKADATTSVATLSYQFFTGSIPSAAGMDYLVSPSGPNPNNLNSNYYQSFNLENRYINFAVNLGVSGEGRAAFTANYGSKTLFDAATAAYQAIFGSVPTDAKVHALIDTRTDYFAAYGGDGPAGLGTKAAMVGWLLAEAAKADVGTMQTANLAFLTDLADGANFAVNIVGVYGGTPFFG